MASPELLAAPAAAAQDDVAAVSAAISRSSRKSWRGTILFLSLALSDLLATNLGFFGAWYARYRLELGGDIEPFNFVDLPVYLPISLAMAVLMMIMLSPRGLYRQPRTRPLVSDAFDILGASAFATMTLYAATTFARYPAESRATFIYAFVLCAAAVTLGRGLVKAVRVWLHGRGIGVERVVVVGDHDLSRMVLQGIAAQPDLGYIAVGFLGSRGRADFGRFPWLGHVDQLQAVVLAKNVDQVIVALPANAHESILKVVDQCRQKRVRFRIVPDLYEIRLGQVDVDAIHGIPLIGLKDTAIRGLNLLLKRGLDVTLGLAIGLLLAVPMALIAILIRLDSPGPILYRQVRMGRDGVRFTLYKFRSMRPGAEEELEELRPFSITDGPTFKVPSDPRRTPMGRILRRLSLDELPQLWNVLKGEMSLVGPRPPTPEEVDLYEPRHMKRLEAFPGMTGLWQVSGRSSLSFDEMVMMDMYYIENWSLSLDLSILLRTLPAVLRGGGAF